MFQTTYKIIKAEKLSETAYLFAVYCPEMAEKAKAGQFVHILCGEKTLRRPISICDIDRENGTLTIVFEVRGEGTAWLAERKVGDELDILGPLGNGFALNKDKKAIFIGGGIGTPPMLGALKAYGKNATAILGFRGKENAILISEFEKNADEVFVTTNDGTLGRRGFVTDVLREKLSADKNAVVYACGPMPMLKGIAAMCEEFDTECFVSLEERMGCGIGACLVCACKTKEKDGEHHRHVCKNGPVFNAREVVFDG